MTSCMQQLSTISSLYWISGNWAADSRQQVRNRPSLIFMMLALWTAVTFLRPSRRAYSKVARAMRVEAALVITFRLSTDAGHHFVLDARSRGPRCSRGR